MAELTVAQNQAIPCYPISEKQLETYLSRINDAFPSDQKLEVAKELSDHHFLSRRQVERVQRFLTFQHTRQAFAQYAKPRICGGQESPQQWPCHPISEAQLETYLSRINNAFPSDQKLEVAKELSDHHFLSRRQVERVQRFLTFQHTRQAFAQYAKPRICGGH